ncbi:MAG: helix-turn-helix transcriptional regulator [Candidatus Pacebacteria bacterium]|nr:helix-turn-helix transcriptional regulator [Candidatus Paceibacterota bacterium]
MKKEALEFGKNLKKLRMSKKMPQAKLGELIGVSRGYISNIEHGKINTTLSTIVKLADALGVSKSRLVR